MLESPGTKGMLEPPGTKGLAANDDILKEGAFIFIVVYYGY